MLNTHYIKIKIDYINIVWYYKREINVKRGGRMKHLKRLSLSIVFTVNILY